MIVRKGSILTISFQEIGTSRRNQAMVLVLKDPKEKSPATLDPNRHLFARAEVRWADTVTFGISFDSKHSMVKTLVAMDELPMSFVESGIAWINRVGDFVLQIALL